MLYQNQNHFYQQPKLSMKLLLICDPSGTIVFSEGDNKIFGLSHDEMLNTSVYDIGLTIFSQLSLKTNLDDMNFDKKRIKTFVLEAIDTQKDQLIQQKCQVKIQKSMNQLIKKIYVQFQEIDVKFQSQNMNERAIQLKKIERGPCKRKPNIEDTLYMLQIEELYSHELEIQTSIEDYQITKKKYMQKKAKILY